MLIKFCPSPCNVARFISLTCIELIIDLSLIDILYTTCVVKNERERTRVRRKADLLERLKYLIKRSSLAEEAKPKRLTEV